MTKLTCEEVAALIELGIPGASVEVKDMTGTSDHFDVAVIADAFEGVGLVQRHQMVYGAIGSAMAGPVHALKLSTQTPAQTAGKTAEVN